MFLLRHCFLLFKILNIKQLFLTFITQFYGYIPLGGLCIRKFLRIMVLTRVQEKLKKLLAQSGKIMAIGRYPRIPKSIIMKKILKNGGLIFISKCLKSLG